MISVISDGLNAVEVSRAMLWIIIPILVTVGFASVGFMLRRFVSSVDALAKQQADTNTLLATMVTRVVHLEETNQRHHEENIARMGNRP